MDALIFDLDDTLLVDEVSATTAFLKTCLHAQAHYGINLIGFQKTIRQVAWQYWQQSPERDFCLRVGISSWEGLWAKFAGPGRNLWALRQWAPIYRRLTWSTTLQLFGIRDEPFALELADHFIACRQELQVVYRDVEPVLSSLKLYFKLGLLANGAPDLQRRKIADNGLSNYFDAILISGEFGVGKPDRRIFEQMLSLLDAEPDSTLMIGDDLKNDIGGGLAAGLKTAWVNRLDSRLDGIYVPDMVVNDLFDLRRILETIPILVPDRGSVSR